MDYTTRQEQGTNKNKNKPGGIKNEYATRNQNQWSGACNQFPTRSKVIAE
jgi:hypothetical protein